MGVFVSLRCKILHASCRLLSFLSIIHQLDSPPFGREGKVTTGQCSGSLTSKLNIKFRLHRTKAEFLNLQSG